MKKVLVFAVLLAAAPAGAQGLEEAAAQSHLNFANAFGSFRVQAFQKTAAPAIQYDAKSAAKATADLSGLFDKGTKVSAADLRGWWAGRRFLSIGVAPALLVGADVPKDNSEGPISGTVFKTFLFPKIKLPDGIGAGDLSPAEYYDVLGSAVSDSVSWIIHEDAQDWVETKFTDSGAITKKGYDQAEIRKNGDYLLAKFEDGSYAYFFKRVK